MPVKPDVPQIVAWRLRRRTRAAHAADARLGRLGLGFVTVLSLLLAVAAIAAALGYSNLTQDLPSIEGLVVLLDGPDGLLYEPTRIYDRSGTQVILAYQNPALEAHTYISLEAFPEALVDATLAANGGDQAYQNIAQLLASDLLLWDEDAGQRRDLRQWLLGRQALAQYGQDRVLEWYLNSADYGQLAFGAAAAAQVYFGKPLQELSLAEAAMLAATAGAPALNPLDAPQLAIERQGAVLQAMLAYGYISTEAAMSANARPLEIQPAVAQPVDQAPAFTALVIKQLEAYIPRQRLLRGGLEIVTTLDADLQAQATCATATQLARLDASQPTPEGDCPAARLLPTLGRDVSPASASLSANAVVLDPLSGQILALVAPLDARTGAPLDHTPGTILSPFIYLTAFTRGFSPASLVWDIPASVPPVLGEAIDPHTEYHGPVSIRTALANDYAAPALGMLAQVGPENAWRIARQSGLNSLEVGAGQESYRLLLDAGTVNLLELAQAFGIFSNRGILTGHASADTAKASLQPTAILQVSDHSGRVWLDWSAPQVRPVVSAQLAYLVTNVLGDDLARQPSLGHPNALEIGRPAAAKLGQTADGANAWAVGYTPQRVVAIWVGYAQPDADQTAAPTPLSPLVAAGLWNALTKYAHTDLPYLAWEEPNGLVSMNVCAPSGLLPTTACPQIVTEIFVPGNQPTQPDNLYRSYQVNRQTGLLATVFTAPELIEEHVYLKVPANASAWAQEAGLDTPPEDYDVIFSAPAADPQVSIQTPALFDYVGGEVSITGNAGGEDFSFYRLQVGEGLNPRQWLQIGEDAADPVQNGRLAIWDTKGLNGLYAVRLTVVRRDNTIETAITQVTVDNQPPDVQITNPQTGQVFSYPDQRNLTFQAQVTDNVEVARVEFFVDGTSITSLSQAPFIAPWNGTAGAHTLEVVATDAAGNQVSTQIDFELAR
jgi:membrane peptidoglycan carboxypeptidase